jgi:choline dehydrogenase-like flavoprotein
LLIDLQQENAPLDLEADVIIIGAGAVGLMMAVELARSGSQVLVLEAGGSGVSAESQAYFSSARSIGHPLQGLHRGRYRALGGTTTFWGGQLAALDPLTYQHRPWLADVRWPIGHADVEPYYARVFSLLGMDEQIADDSEVWRRLRVTPPEAVGDLTLFFTRWAPEPNFARLFEADILRAPKLTVIVNAPVTALQTDSNGHRVTHVQINAGAKGALTARARVYVMASGAIETPRLLLSDLATGQAPPWSGNHWIGRGFMDHVGCVGGTVTPLDRRRFHNLFDNVVLDGIKYQPKIKLSEQAQVERKLLSVSADFVFHSSISEHVSNAKILFKVLFKAALKGKTDVKLLKSAAQVISLFRYTAPMIGRYIRDHRVYSFADRGISVGLNVEQKPLVSSAVLLREERDALGMPLIDVDWEIDGGEIETLACFAEMLAEYLAKNGLARLDINPTLANRDVAVIAGAYDTSHHMGTTRMASDPSAGVVDGNMKVHGIENLYVAGAAVYPTTGFQNPTFTAMALGLRLAASLRGTGK